VNAAVANNCFGYLLVPNNKMRDYIQSVASLFQLINIAYFVALIVFIYKDSYFTTLNIAYRDYLRIGAIIAIILLTVLLMLSLIVSKVPRVLMLVVFFLTGLIDILINAFFITISVFIFNSDNFTGNQNDIYRYIMASYPIFAIVVDALLQASAKTYAAHRLDHDTPPYSAYGRHHV
jgi:hypothetical protein